jgi:hypothetical protein
MAGLNWKTLCNLYTLEQINEKITLYQSQLESAMVKMYDRDTTQGRQKVESADIEKIESILQAWMKAKECKTGVSGSAVIASHNFRNGNRGGIV